MFKRGGAMVLFACLACVAGRVSAQQVTTIGQNILLPLGIAVDGAQTVYVTNRQANNITKIAPNGTTSVFSTAYLGLHGVAVNGSGDVLVADYRHVDKYPASGAWAAPISGSQSVNGYADGPGANARFDKLTGLALQASTGVVFVGDYNNNRVRRIAPNGATTTYPTPTSTFAQPYGVAVDAAGNVFVSEYANHRIMKISPSGAVGVFAGSGTAGAANGTGAAASFKNPAGLAVDAAGNLWVADMGNHLIRKITSAGVVSTYAGSGTAGQADGLGTAASFNAPSAVAVDSAGIVYVADYQTGRVRRIAPRSRVVGTTVLTASSATLLNTSALAVAAAPECGQWGANKLSYDGQKKDMPCNATFSVKPGTPVAFWLDYQCVTNGSPCVTTYQAEITLPDNSHQSIAVPANSSWSYVFSQSGAYLVGFQASCSGLSCQNACAVTIQSH